MGRDADLCRGPGQRELRQFEVGGPRQTVGEVESEDRPRPGRPGRGVALRAAVGLRPMNSSGWTCATPTCGSRAAWSNHPSAGPPGRNRPRCLLVPDAERVPRRTGCRTDDRWRLSKRSTRIPPGPHPPIGSSPLRHGPLRRYAPWEAHWACIRCNAGRCARQVLVEVRQTRPNPDGWRRPIRTGACYVSGLARCGEVIPDCVVRWRGRFLWSRRSQRRVQPGSCLPPWPPTRSSMFLVLSLLLACSSEDEAPQRRLRRRSSATPLRQSR